MRVFAISAVFGLLAAPVLADSHVTGDAGAGEAVFAKQCISCHVVVNEAGETLAGRSARSGPNLYGISGRAVGGLDGFRYGESIQELGEAGNVWDEEKFVGYVMDPTGWLRTALDDKSARGKMAFKVRKAEDALNIYAYLVSIGPEMDMSDDDDDEGDDEKAPATN